MTPTSYRHPDPLKVEPIDVFRPFSISMAVGTVASGTGCAMLHGNVEPMLAVVCFFFAIFMQVGANIMYHYNLEKNYLHKNRASDAPESVRIDTTLLPFLPKIAGVFMLLAGMCSLGILAMSYWWALLIGAAIIVLGWLTLSAKKPFCDSPLHLVMTAILFGPIAVIGTCLVQTAAGAPGDILNHFDLGPAVYMCFIACAMTIDCDVVRIFRGSADPISLARRPFAERMSRRATVAILAVCGIVEAILGVGVAVAVATKGAAVAWWVTSIIGGLVPLAMNIYVIKQLPAKGEPVSRSLSNLLYLKCLVGGLMVLLIFSLLGLPDDNPSFPF